MLQTALKVIEGKHSGKIIPLEKGNFIVGRERDCHLRPNSEMISRHHCVFKIDDYTVRLRDLGSTNGTFVNGERIHSDTVLKDGDAIHIGKLAFQVSVNNVAGETATIAAHETAVQIPPPVPSALDDSSVISPHVEGGTTVIATVQISPKGTPAQPVPVTQAEAGEGQIPYPQQQQPVQQQAAPSQPIPAQEPPVDSSQPVSRIPAPPIKLPPPPAKE